MTVAADPPIRPTYRMGFLWAICLTAAMGGLLFGYDYVVIGGAKPFYEPYFGINDSPFWQGFSMSSALLGCLVGAAISGPTSDRFGRRGPLIASALVFLVSAIGTAMAGTLLLFNLFRALCGVGIGLASNLSPMYIAEMAPAETRGRFVAINQLTIVIGILAAQVVNWLISLGVPENATPALIAGSWYGQQAWRWMFASGSVPALAFLLMMFAVPESPRWLVKAGREEPALRTLTRVGGPAYGRG
jgi:MFS family permease